MRYIRSRKWMCWDGHCVIRKQAGAELFPSDKSIGTRRRKGKLSIPFLMMYIFLLLLLAAGQYIENKLGISVPSFLIIHHHHGFTCYCIKFHRLIGFFVFWFLVLNKFIFGNLLELKLVYVCLTSPICT